MLALHRFLGVKLEMDLKVKSLLQEHFSGTKGEEVPVSFCSICVLLRFAEICLSEIAAV